MVRNKKRGFWDWDSGSTEAIGSIMLVSVGVIALATVGVMVLADDTPQKLPAVQAVISASPDGEIYIYHDGGDVVAKGELQFLVNNQVVEFLKEDGSVTGADWETFSMGETLVYKAPPDQTVNSVDVFFGSGATSSVVASAQFAPDTPGTTAPVVSPPAAGFSGMPLSGDAPLTVVFTDTSTNTPTSWSWTLGDGTNSAAQNPTHTYTTAGTYTVSLTVTNAYGNDTLTRAGYITVSQPPVTDKPVTGFNGTPTFGAEPLTVQFTDTSTNTPASWSWDFGDGTNSTAQNPSHTYLTAGTYTVSLTATNAAGSDTLTRGSYITVVKYIQGWHATYFNDETWTTPVFTNYPSRLHFANQMAVYNHSPCDTDVHNWPYPYLGRTEYFSADFDGYLRVETEGYYKFFLKSDDGSYLTIDGTTVIDNGGLHPPLEKSGTIYLGTGYHPIDVREFNHAEAAVLVLEYESQTTGMSRQYVTDIWHVVTADPPVADFSGTPTSGSAPLTVQFTDASTNTPASWAWDFGDGMNSTAQNPSHTYTAAGTYTVTLTATNEGGSDSKTRTGYITVTPASTQIPADRAYLVTDNKCGYLGSGQYMQFTVTGYWSYIEQERDTFNLYPGDVVRLTLNSDTKGELYATSTYISEFNFEDVTVTINGVSHDPGRIHNIWISNYNTFSSTLTLNVPSKKKWTQLIVDGSTIIYGTDNQEITLHNLHPTTWPDMWPGMNLNNHDCSDVFYNGGITAYTVA